MQPAASWKAVLEVTKTAWTQNDPPLVFGMDVVTCIHERGIGLPSIELAQVLVHCLATGGPSVATMWAYIQHAMSCHMVSALHMLALLTSRILPSRQQQPEMYKMYLDLTSTYAFSLSSTKSIPCRDRVVKAVDEALQLSKNPEAPIAEVGVVIVHFLFALVARLAEAVYEDWISNKGMAYDEGLEQLKKNNSLAAVHLMAKIMENKRTAGLLRIARRNLPDQWTLFVQRLQLLESLTNDASSMAPKEAMEALGQLAKAIQQGLRQEWRPTQMPVIRSLLPSQSRSWSFGNAGGLGCSSLWLPFDVYMEAAMEGRRLSTTSNADVLADVMKAMQSVHMANWVDLFLGLWTAALRLVRRNRDSIEGPSPHVESRLCMLLAITPIAIGIVIDDEERGQLHPENASGELQPSAPATNVVGVRRAALETCLQVLGQFEALLVPPPIVAAAANQVAAKAAAFASTGGQSMSADISNSGKSAVGTMRHLIVESCIARGLLANTAYYWLGTGGAMANIPASPPQPSPWAAFMDGAPLSAPLRAALMTSPAGSLAELEKIHKTAMVGPEEERPAAASILCGASLLRSWTVQEHAVHFAVQLLSPPVSDNWGGSNNGLLAHAPMLCAALQGMNNADVMNVLSLFGMFPEIAAALLPICEMFGSVTNAKPIATSMGEEISAHMLFTLAFLKLVKLWKFHRPPLEHCLLGSGAGLGADLSLEYLLQLRNIQLVSPSRQRMQFPGSSYPTSPTGVVTLDSFPRLRVWYMQHQACISSTISSVLRSNPMHQVGDRLLAMMFKKVNKTGSASTPGLSGNASGPSEDAAGRPILCAWDVIQAVPNVLEYALTACSHSTLSPRELTTGLRELVDYLPATIATIVSYCLAEVTRGLWKYASMNGQDWPSPAANLLAIQGEVKDILAASGVDFTSNPPGAGGGNAPVSLPLPLAALIGLTITFKLDKTGETVLSIAGPGLETCSSAGPWFSIQVVAALWAQKVKRWHDYIVFMGACHIFKQNKTALLQLLKNMFAVTLSTATAPGSKLQVNGGVGALLGHGPWSAYAPGILYLRSYSTLHDIMFLSCETLDLVAQAARELGSQGDVSAADHGSRLRCVQASLSTCMARAVQASSLGASLLYVSGGTTLVTKLFTESIPTWFLSGSGSKGAQSPGGMVLEGYAIAHFALLSGALAWGVSAQTCQSESSGVPGLMQRHRVLGSHMEFVASGLGGELTMSCEQTLWRSYVVGFLALMVTCTPTWILELKVETLRKLATGLRFWHEHDLAVALLERGGPSAMGAAAELTLC